MLALLLARCAGRAGPGTGVEPLLPYERQPDSCAPSPVPPQLPTVGEVLDTSGVRQRLAPATSQPSPIVFTIEFSSVGAVSGVRVAEAVGDSQSVDFLRTALASSIRPQRPAPPWSIRLRVAPDRGTPISVERSEFCPPTPLDSQGPQLAHAVTPMTLQELEELRRAGPFRIRVRVDAAGLVSRAELVQSSGSSFQDRFALDRARERRFRPARLDGVPVPGWYEIRSRR